MIRDRDSWNPRRKTTSQRRPSPAAPGPRLVPECADAVGRGDAARGERGGRPGPQRLRGPEGVLAAERRTRLRAPATPFRATPSLGPASLHPLRGDPRGVRERGLRDHAARSREDENDLYVRATLFVVEGHYGQDTVSDLVLTAYQMPKAPAETDPRRGEHVASRRRHDDAARIKTGPNYQVARLARIEGRSRGFDDMLLMNSSGRMAESTGACLLMVSNGTIVTPPTWEGAMVGITADALAGICATLGIPFEQRPIERTELYIAGRARADRTLTEITSILSVDERRSSRRGARA